MARIKTPIGGSRGTNGLYRMEHLGRQALWTSDGDEPMQKPLLVCARIQEGGHQEVDAILTRR